MAVNSRHTPSMYDKNLPIVQKLRSERKDPAVIIAAVHAATPHVKRLRKA
jgi:hypothetical protein